MRSPVLSFSCCFLLLASLFFACEGEKENNPHELIAGADSKTWVASKEINIEGEEEKLSPAEGQQELQFFSNGTFQMKNKSEFHTGKWTYEGGNRELQLIFDDKPALAEVFYVNRLEKDQINVRAPDGGTMKLVVK
jgi:hypothetical protein